MRTTLCIGAFTVLIPPNDRYNLAQMLVPIDSASWAPRLPDVSARLADQLFDIRTSTPEQFAALIKSDVAKWSQVVREGNIKPE